MRALVLSDVHANLEALRAVIEDATSRDGFDIIWSLGDLVGYGPDPCACLELLRQHNLLAVAGNHDHAAIGRISVGSFNSAAQSAVIWTSEQLSTEEAEFLGGLSLVAVNEPFTLVHGSLRDPLVEYLLDERSAAGTLARLETRFCLVGHSHIPFLCLENGGRPRFVQFTEGREFQLGEERWIINPGAVGQPRDRDPRPSYAIYDSQRMTIQRHRVTYDIEKTQAKMRLARLPEYLVERLAYGM